jgi:hypothetical protein
MTGRPADALRPAGPVWHCRWTLCQPRAGGCGEVAAGMVDDQVVGRAVEPRLELGFGTVAVFRGNEEPFKDNGR